MQLAIPTRPKRKPSLTPMIDVVFLLLVFFMLASRFGIDAVMPLPLAAGGGTYNGPPRLVDISPAQIELNGIPTDQTALTSTLAPMMSSMTDTIILRGQHGATLQRIVEITEILNNAGFTAVVLVE